MLCRFQLEYKGGCCNFLQSCQKGRSDRTVSLQFGYFGRATGRPSSSRAWQSKELHRTSEKSIGSRNYAIVLAYGRQSVPGCRAQRTEYPREGRKEDTH